MKSLMLIISTLLLSPCAAHAQALSPDEVELLGICRMAHEWNTLEKPMAWSYAAGYEKCADLVPGLQKRDAQEADRLAQKEQEKIKERFDGLVRGAEAE